MNPSEEKTELRTVDDFIAFFSAIPEEKWIEGYYSTGDSHCALGHVGQYSAPADTLRDLFREHLDVGVGFINDRHDLRFNQETPRARILAALNAIKANQEKK